MRRHRNDGLRKICSHHHSRWPKCKDAWHFNFKYGGRAYRFSLDRHLGRHVGTRTEAEREADLIRVAIRAGRFQLGGADVASSVNVFTVSGLITSYQREYLDVYRRSAAVEARRLKLVMAAVIVRSGRSVRFGEIVVNDLTVRDIDALILAKLTGRRKHCHCNDKNACGHPWREPSAGGRPGLNRDLARLKACFNWGLKRGLLSRTPFSVGGVTAVSMLREAPRYRRLEPGEEPRLLQEATPHLRALIVAALETGCRKGELLSLQWSQVRVHRSEIYLPARKTKAGRERLIPMSKNLAAVLEMRRLDPVGKEYPPDAYVFGTVTGERIASVDTAWRRACQRAEIADLEFRDLRREAGSRWMESGRFHLHEVQRLLDHADIATTSRYLQASRFGLRSAMRAYDSDKEKMGDGELSVDKIRGHGHASDADEAERPY